MCTLYTMYTVHCSVSVSVCGVCSSTARSQVSSIIYHLQTLLTVSPLFSPPFPLDPRSRHQSVSLPATYTEPNKQASGCQILLCVSFNSSCPSMDEGTSVVTTVTLPGHLGKPGCWEANCDVMLYTHTPLISLWLLLQRGRRRVGKVD